MGNEKIDSRNIFHTSLSESANKRNLSNLSVGVLKLQFLFDIKSFYVKLLIVGLISVFSGIYNFFLLERTGLYSLGINALFQAIARCVSYFMSNSFPMGAKALHSMLFWGMTMVVNVPLAIMAYRNIGTNFAKLSIFSIFVSSITSIIFASLPPSLGLKDFYLFSDPRSFNRCLSDKGINILQWNYVTLIKENGGAGAGAAGAGANYFSLNDSSNISLMFFYGLIFGLFNTFTALVIYSLGGSTGGFDWIAFYLSKKKINTSSNLFLYFGLIMSFLSYLIGTYIPYISHMLGHDCSSNVGASNGTTLTATKALNAKFYSPISNAIGPVFVASVIAAFTRRICFNIFYPHFKLINVKIFTNKVLELRKKLLSSNFPHSFTITSATGGYLLRNQMIFEITCFSLELKTLKEYAMQVDSNCLIVATSIRALSGRLTVKDNLN